MLEQIRRHSLPARPAQRAGPPRRRCDRDHGVFHLGALPSPLRASLPDLSGALHGTGDGVVQTEGSPRGRSDWPEGVHVQPQGWGCSRHMGPSSFPSSHGGVDCTEYVDFIDLTCVLHLRPFTPISHLFSDRIDFLLKFRLPVLGVFFFLLFFLFPFVMCFQDFSTNV